MKSQKPSYSQVRLCVAYHEAGHVVAARALGLLVVASIWWDGKKLNNTTKSVRGVTTYAPQTTRLNRAIMGWAGVVGEEVGVYRLHGFPYYIFEGMSELMWDEYNRYPDLMPALDAEAIGHGKLSRKGFEQAVLIITGNRDKVHQCAQQLIRSLRRGNPNPPAIDFSSMECRAVLPARVAKSLSAKNSAASLPR